MRPLLILVMLLGFACATDAARSAAPRRTTPVAVIIKGERRSPELRAAIVQTIRRTNELPNLRNNFIREYQFNLELIK